MLQLISVDLKKDKIGTLIVPVCEDKEIHDHKELRPLIKRAKDLEEFKGGAEEPVTFYSPKEIKAPRVTLSGLGKLEKVNRETLRSLAGKAIKDSMKKGISEVWIAVPKAEKMDMELSSVLEALGEGAVLGNHLFSKYKKEEKQKPLKKIHLIVGAAEKNEFTALPARIETICRGTLLAREWVNTPSNDKTPEQLSKSIIQAAGKENLTFTVLDDKALRQKKFGAMLAVAAGSRSKPRMVVLEYRPRGAKKTVALVGKGVTFDSGGINLKPTGSLDTMKADMSGAAVVAAALITVAKVKPKINVIGLMPIVENMPSGTASRPGDIVGSYAGKTVEIGNTDAEGRLILIDAMSYAIKTYKPQTLIDLATLTGACVVALGEKIAGAFSFDDDLAEAIIQAGERTYERCWRLPMPEDYREQYKSDFADLKNIGNSRYGGAITAALFLSEFVNDTRWAHIDIAGPSYSKKDSAYCGAGGTGFGVRLLCDLLEKL